MFGEPLPDGALAVAARLAAFALVVVAAFLTPAVGGHCDLRLVARALTADAQGSVGDLVQPLLDRVQALVERMPAP